MSPKNRLEVVLFEPQIPANAGNIVRTCACTGAALTLVRPLGFHTSDRALKRAGLDYWLGVDVEIVEDLETYLEGKPFTLFTSHGQKGHTEMTYEPDSLLVFGSETHGLPEGLRGQHPDRCARIPMLTGNRCLNLSNAVAVGLYEAWRQLGNQRI